jgi:hypothetical protein
MNDSGSLYFGVGSINPPSSGTGNKLLNNKAPQADFKRLKQRISIDQVLARYGVRLRRVGPHTLYGRCPLPTNTERNLKDSPGNSVGTSLSSRGNP